MRTEVEALKEIRDRLSYFCARLDGKYDPPWVTEVIGIIDDVLIKPHRKDSARIENNMAAHNREKDGYKDTIKPWCDKVGVVKMETTTKENLAVGNNAKMREVLGVVVDACDTVFKMAHDSDFVKKWAVSTRNVATKALAAPPKNCNLYDSEEDAWEAFLKLHPNAECPNDEYEMWLFDPVEEKGGVE